MNKNYQFGVNVRLFLKGFLINSTNKREDKESIDNTYLDEPILNVEEIQGNIILGFNKPLQHFIFFRISKPDLYSKAIATYKSRITNAKEIIQFRKQFQKVRNNPLLAEKLSTTWINVAFSYEGLKKVLPNADNLVDNSFKRGFLDKYNSVIHDSSTVTWELGNRTKIDCVFIIAGDVTSDVKEQVDFIKALLQDCSQLVFESQGSLFKEENRGKEHFGFKDGISQPAIRGRISNNENDFLVRRKSQQEPDLDEEDQDMIWPGEFVFGYPGQNKANYNQPGSQVDAGVDWAKNGSYLVFNRYTQDVAKFKKFLVQTTENLVKKNSSLLLTPEQLAAKLMGRTFEGEPLTNNDVPFLTSPSIHRVKGKNIDQEGLKCPFSAHIRKSYPKNDIDTAELHQHRILRRGIPFGDPTSKTDEKGLLFLCYQTSIEKQFEHIFFKWMHNGDFVKNGTGKDPILGFSNSSGDKTCPFKFAMRDATGKVEEITLDLPSDIINLTGGEYFFSPSISTLSLMAS